MNLGILQENRILGLVSPEVNTPRLVSAENGQKTFWRAFDSGGAARLDDHSAEALGGDVGREGMRG